MDWHGYPQHPDAHPQRPWWRRSGDDESPWVRSDNATLTPVAEYVGGDTYDAGWQSHDGWVLRVPDVWMGRMAAIHTLESGSLATYDAEHPLPPPEPRCGQVWVWVAASAWQGLQMTVSTVTAVGGVHFGTRRDAWDAPWPPPGAVLVAGPGAPWAPMGGADV